VLYFEELQGDQGLLVLSQQWARNMLRDFGGELVATDAKCNTTVKCKSMFSSILCPTKKGWVGGAVWISEGGDGWSL
jgi:hypothetical protein